MNQKQLNDLGYKIIGCAIQVHKTLGPGLLESIYQTCMVEELRFQGLFIQEQVQVPIFYREKPLKTPLKLDLLVEKLIMVELKAVEIILPVHKAQLLSYMKLGNIPKGILLNFNTETIVKSAVHMVTEQFANLPVE